MHDSIKRFHLNGTVTSDKFVTTRENLIKEVEDEMRDEGFVPVLDLIPQFTREYNPDDGTFVFELSVYGVEVGEEESWNIVGVTHGVTVERSTRRTK